MTLLGDVIRDTRRKAGLGEPLMAQMVGMNEERLRAIEAGAVQPGPDELDACAQVFGVSLRDFATGAAGDSPLAHLFFRSLSQAGAPSLEELVALDAHRTLGEFVRTVRDTAELQDILGKTRHPPSLPLKLIVVYEKAAPHGAPALAAAVRQHLGLGIEPIESMRALLEQLGVSIYWTTPEELDPVIDGASISRPTPAVLVNLVEGPQCWWRTRMTLGHELCHLLCDHKTDEGDIAIFSPHVPNRLRRTRWRVFEGFNRIERRASAFAAHLLLPWRGVHETIGGRDPTTEAAIDALCQKYGIGRTTAINRLEQVYGFSKATRHMMESRRPSQWHAADHVDSVTTGIGLRSGLLQDLAIQAFAAGRLDRARVRAYLRLPLTEPLPDDPRLSVEQRAPVRTVEDRVRGVAQLHLEAKLGRADCVAGRVTSGEGGWQVEIEPRNAGAPHEGPRRIQVSYEFEVVAIESNV